MDGFFNNAGLDIGLYIGYLLVIGAALAAILFPIVQVIKNPRDIAKSGMAVGSLVIIFILAYAISGSEITPKYIALGVDTETNSKMIGAGLIMFYIVFLVAIIGLIYSEINKAIK